MFHLLKCKSCHLRHKIIRNISETKCICVFCTRPKSYYQVLGLDSAATPKDIKSAYYKLSLQFHPDKNDGCPESAVKFREITEAYETLSNPEKKKNYDLSGTSYESPYYRKTYGGTYYRDTPKSYYRSRSYQGPFTGKTSGFDYDEHYRQHYQNEYERRKAEHEYFKRRWEAEFYKRYPNFEEFYYRRKPGEEKRVDYEEIKSHWSLKRNPYFLFITFWSLILLITSLDERFNPEKSSQNKKRKIYYDAKQESSNTVDK